MDIPWTVENEAIQKGIVHRFPFVNHERLVCVTFESLFTNWRALLVDCVYPGHSSSQSCNSFGQRHDLRAPAVTRRIAALGGH